MIKNGCDYLLLNFRKPQVTEAMFSWLYKFTSFDLKRRRCTFFFLSCVTVNASVFLCPFREKKTFFVQSRAGLFGGLLPFSVISVGFAIRKQLEISRKMHRDFGQCHSNRGLKRECGGGSSAGNQPMRTAVQWAQINFAL
jgi:hypothetical protein